MYGLVPAEGNVVYNLPPGLIEEHTYKPDEQGGSGFRSIASGFSEFLSRLIAGLEQHVLNGAPGPFQ
jgi:hypothetical protein